MNRDVKIRSRVVLIAAAAALTNIGIVSYPCPAMAQQSQPHHRTLLQRHPHAGEAAAGIGAYEVAKHTGRSRRRHGRHRNLMQRHPVLTGMAAAGMAHHYAHKHHKQ